jgi:transposase
VRSRIDRKYALSLELTDSGFDHTVLSEFRTRLLAGGAEQLLLDPLLTQVRARGLLKARARDIGLAKTHLQHLLTAVVLNMVHLGAWRLGMPLVKTRCAPLATPRKVAA